MNSLRAQLTLFWIILLAVCAALALVMVGLFRSSAGTQIEEARTQAEGACAAIATRYAKSLADPQREAPQLDLLQVLLQLVLIEEPHVEGGVWKAHGENAADGGSGASVSSGANPATRADTGFLAYAYPTYEGSSVKRDVPEAEQAHIAEVAQIAARTARPETDVVRASREALVVSACPLQSPRGDLAAWTMTRTPLATLDAQHNLRIGLGALLAFVLASGLWLGAILLRGYRHMQRLEAQLAQADGSETAPPLAPIGLRELDRLVDGLNRYRARFEQVRAQLRDAERARSRDQRLAALGRMTGGVAHEIRNPIAAMRLKAENALAGPAEKQPAALRVILDQVARLDGLVTSLLAVVQPLNLQIQPVDLAEWADERLAGVRERAAAKGVRLDLQTGPTAPVAARFDPLHLARAVDNLLDNAVRHAREGGCVTLSIRLSDAPSQSLGPKRAPGERLVLRVDDDGPGVPADLHDQLFEPFATGRPDGTGLGLALAREVALAHGGDLTHTARAEGGARFELELPWRAC